MNTDHWFDRLNKVLVGGASRRATRRTAAALTAGLLLGGAPAATAKPKRCAKALCARHFKSKQERQRCEEKCGRCRVRAKFCVAGPDLAHPDATRHATCCKARQKCCQDALACCPAAAECCPAAHVKAGKASCCAGTCCLDAPSGCCNSAEAPYCCPGVGCVADQAACACATSGDCPDTCPDGRPRCNGRCCPRLLSGQYMRCFGGTECCPPDYVEPFRCPGQAPIPGVVCQPDASHVCCDGYHAIVGTEDPTTYVCCGRGSTAYVALASVGCFGREQYPPLATRTYGEG